MESKRPGYKAMEVSVEKQQSSSRAPKPQTRNDGKRSLRGKSLRGRRKGPRRPCKGCFSGNCTNPCCNFWHPPECQQYKTQSGCKFGEKCLFRHKEVDSQLDTMPAGRKPLKTRAMDPQGRVENSQTNPQAHRTKLHSTRFRELGVCQRHPQRNRGKRIRDAGG